MEMEGQSSPMPLIALRPEDPFTGILGFPEKGDI